MINTLLLSLILSAAPSPAAERAFYMQNQLTLMRMEQTQPQYAPRVTPLPPGCGPFGEAQRQQQSLTPLQPYYYRSPYIEPYQPYIYPYYRLYRGF
jgi:hypothetical protein